MSDSSEPQITVDSQLMENYRIATAVTGGSDMLAIRNAAGDVELFTVGNDGTVWNFYPDASSDTGYSEVALPFQSASAIAAGIDSNGNLNVFAAGGLQFSYCTETPDGATRWSTAVTVAVPQPLSPISISRVVAETIGGQLYVAVLTGGRAIPSNVYRLAWSAWDPVKPQFTQTSFSLASLNAVWMGNSAATAAFAAVDGIIVSYGIESGKTTSLPIAEFHSVDVAVANDGNGNTQTFAVLNDGNLYQLASTSGQYSWNQLTQQMTLRQTAAVADEAGNIELFAVDGGNWLYHFEPMSNSLTGYSAPAVAIAAGVSAFAVAADDGGDVDVFTTGTSLGALTHLYEEEASSNWASNNLEVPTGDVESYSAYVSDVTLYDADGALLVNTPVTVTPAEETFLTINGATYFVDPANPASLSTNAAGMLSIAQAANGLSVPRLQIYIPSLMPANTSLAIQQDAGVQDTLANATGTDLMNAQQADGSYLLPEKYRTVDTANSLAAACNNCMDLAGDPGFRVPRFARGRTPKRGVWIREGAASDLTRLAGPSRPQHWRLSFSGEGVRHEMLTERSARLLIAQKRATLPSAFGLFDWLDDVGDFFAGVVDGFVSIVDTVVTTITGGVMAAVTFVANGIQYLFETTVTLIEQAFDLVGSFFAQVGVAFAQLFQWLGLIFSWDKIVLTHSALSYALTQFLGFLSGAAPGIQTLVDNGISTLSGQITTLFTGLLDAVGSQTMGGYDSSNEEQSPSLFSAVANNIVFNGVINNTGGTTSTIASSSFDALIPQLQTYAGTLQTNGAFTSATTFFTTLGGSLDQIFTQLLSALIKLAEAIVQAVLAGVQATADALLGMVGSIISALQTVLAASWNIPFVSQFYSSITGGATLTTVDLLALIVAIPATVLYTATYGVAPIPDQDSLIAFESSFSAATMLSASGLSSGNTPARRAAWPVTNVDSISSASSQLLAVAGAVATFFYGGCTAILDAIEAEAPSILSVAAFGLESLAQVCAFPWFSGSGAPDCSTQAGAEAWMWIYECIGVAMDGVYVAAEGSIPENWNDMGVLLAMIYGVGHLAVASVAVQYESDSGAAEMLVPIVPELSKILRLSTVVAATESVSLAVVAAIDGIFYTTASVLQVAGGSGNGDALAHLSA